MPFLLLIMYIATLVVLVFWNVYVALAVIFITSTVFKANFATIKGALGERRINNKLAGLGEDYKIYHDIYVKKTDGNTTQVDHVVLSPYGIFVIETKNYAGWIFGNEKQKSWMQVIYKRKERFYNPILQNEGHIKALKDYLKFDTNFHSIIVFSDEAKLKFETTFTKADVIQTKQLSKLMKQYKNVKFSPIQLEQIQASLDKLVITDRKQKKQLKKNHLKQVKSKTGRVTPKKVVDPNKNDEKCPKCGQKLITKKGKYGQFRGCSNYPACRHSEKVSQ